MFLAGGGVALRTRGRGRGRRSVTAPAVLLWRAGALAVLAPATGLLAAFRVAVGSALAPPLAPLPSAAGAATRFGAAGFSRALAVPAPRPGSGSLRPFTPPVADPVSVLARVSSPAPLPELFCFPVATPLAALRRFLFGWALGHVVTSPDRRDSSNGPALREGLEKSNAPAERRCPGAGCRRGPTAQLGEPTSVGCVRLPRQAAAAGRKERHDQPHVAGNVGPDMLISAVPRPKPALAARTASRLACLVCPGPRAP